MVSIQRDKDLNESCSAMMSISDQQKTVQVFFNISRYWDFVMKHKNTLKSSEFENGNFTIHSEVTTNILLYKFLQNLQLVGYFTC